MRVKICGITNLEDAISSIKAGADALGFVFYEKSPRYITPKKAKEIIKNLPPFVEKVALFVQKTPKEIDDICSFTRCTLAQIHFEAEYNFFNSLKTPHLKVIRAKSKKDILKYKDEYRLIDAFCESYGGSGKRLNLEWFKGVDCSKIILAGGLSEEILDEVKKYNFYGVDVSSSVESYKGKKNSIKVKNFIKTAKS